MPQETNLNNSPYFDDFNRDNEYYRVLFKPGIPVQSRELTNLQSILQNQIEQFDVEFTYNYFTSNTTTGGSGFGVNASVNTPLGTFAFPT